MPAKVTKPKKAPKKAPKKVPKKKLRPIKKLRKDLWDLISLFVRTSHADRYGICTCYTCGVRTPWKEIQAGHAVAGRGNAVLFDTRIIKPQCPQCNIFKHGNYQVFVPKLINEIGQDLYEEIERGSHKELKLARPWYVETIELYKSKLKGGGT